MPITDSDTEPKSDRHGVGIGDRLASEPVIGIRRNG
jgi:hypothetical protein